MFDDIVSTHSITTSLYCRHLWTVPMLFRAE